jgi:hypothetical protein
MPTLLLVSVNPTIVGPTIEAMRRNRARRPGAKRAHAGRIGFRDVDVDPCQQEAQEEIGDCSEDQNLDRGAARADVPQIDHADAPAQECEDKAAAPAKSIDQQHANERPGETDQVYYQP